MEKIKMATREAYGKALAELATENENVVVLDADLSKSTKTADFAKVAPERFINAGIAEANMIGVACGLATVGKIPFASTFAVFAAGRTFDQVRNSVCYAKLNVKVAATHAGITVGEDGGSHQSVEDIALMRALPGMSVLCPCDWVSAKWAVKAAAKHVGPVYLRLGRLATPQIYEADQEFRWGKGQIVQPGNDIVLFACGMMVNEALEAAKLLSQEGIKAAVADLHTIKPLDIDFVLDQIAHCGAAMSIEEHSIIGGLGDAISEVIAENSCAIPFHRMGVNDCFGQSGSPLALLRYYGLDAEAIANQAKAVLAKKK